MTTSTKKLSLKKQTLRRLDDGDLAAVGGGFIVYESGASGAQPPAHRQVGFTNRVKNAGLTNWHIDPMMRW